MYIHVCMLMEILQLSSMDSVWKRMVLQKSRVLFLNMLICLMCVARPRKGTANPSDVGTAGNSAKLACKRWEHRGCSKCRAPATICLGLIHCVTDHVKTDLGNKIVEIRTGFFMFSFDQCVKFTGSYL